MLKIKDNVDLKELEKYGFQDEGVFYRMAWFVGMEAQAYLVVTKDTREISICGGSYMEELFNLIQAGLVENVAD